MAAKKKKAKPKSDKAKYLRLLILQNPDKSAAELVEIAKKKGGSISRATKQNFYNAQTVVRKRYGDEPIVHHNGKLNRTDLCRRVLQRKPDMKDLDVVKFLSTDGVAVTTTLVSQARMALKKASTKTSDHPDPKAGTGPRAGGVKGMRRRRRRTKKEIDAAREASVAETSDQYEAIEHQLDRLIAQASELGNRKLAASCKQARRIASSELV